MTTAECMYIFASPDQPKTHSRFRSPHVPSSSSAYWIYFSLFHSNVLEFRVSKYFCRCEYLYPTSMIHPPGCKTFTVCQWHSKHASHNIKIWVRPNLVANLHLYSRKKKTEYLSSVLPLLEGMLYDYIETRGWRKMSGYECECNSSSSVDRQPGRSRTLLGYWL